MAQLFYGSLTNNGTRLQYYRTGGEDKPVLLFLHGLVANSFTWGKLPLLFMAEYDCVFLDFRGHGLSALGNEPVTLTQLAEDVKFVIEELQLECVSIAGHSLGAMVAMIVAAQYPHLVRALVLFDPPLRLGRRKPQGEALEQVVAGWRSMQEQTFDEYKDSFGAEYNWMSEPLLRQHYKSMRLFRPELLHGLYSQPFEWPPLAAGIACPGLVFAADDDRPHVPADAEAVLRSQWPLATLTRVENSDHLLHMPHVRAIEPVMDKFLRQARKNTRQR